MEATCDTTDDAWADEAPLAERDETIISDSENAYSVRSLARGLAILRCFNVEHPEWGVAELSRHLRLNKATVYRLVKTLESEGFLSAGPANGRYHVGSALLRVAFVALSNSRVRRIAKPYMERLARETGESVDLAVWTEEGVLFIDQVLTSRPFKPVSSVGRVFSDYSNAHSKVFLAFMSESELASALTRPLVPLTPFSITSPQRLAAELRKVAAEGVAYDFQEQSEGVCAVAAPIRDPSGKPAASLAIVAPVSRFGPVEVPRLVASLKGTAAVISREMGYEQTPES